MVGNYHITLHTCKKRKNQGLKKKKKYYTPAMNTAHTTFVIKGALVWDLISLHGIMKDILQGED